MMAGGVLVVGKIISCGKNRRETEIGADIRDQRRRERRRMERALDHARVFLWILRSGR